MKKTITETPTQIEIPNGTKYLILNSIELQSLSDLPCVVTFKALSQNNCVWTWGA